MSDFIQLWSSNLALGENLPEMFAVMAVFGIPIVAILTAHQRKMAQIINERHQVQQAAVNPQVAVELAQLRAEVARLRDVVNQQVLAADRTSALYAPPTVPEEHLEIR